MLFAKIVEPSSLTLGDVVIIRYKNKVFDKAGVYLFQSRHVETFGLNGSKFRDGAQNFTTHYNKCVCLLSTVYMLRGEDFEYPEASPIPGHSLTVWKVNTDNIQETLSFFLSNLSLFGG